jgi:hypothetical protein
MSNTNEHDLLNRELRPELLSRQGEFVAWGSTLLAIGAWAYLAYRGEHVHPIFILLGAFILLSALALTLGNWVDRRTVIYIQADRIKYSNGLRSVELRWDQINQAAVYPSRMGKKVHVQAERLHFNFRTHAEIKSRGKVKGYVGFIEGQAILEHILINSDLSTSKKTGSATYYTRA